MKRSTMPTKPATTAQTAKRRKFIELSERGPMMAELYRNA